MNPPFTQIQLIARDREEEIRKEANQRYMYGVPTRVERPRLQERLASTLRGFADRLDPSESYGTGTELCTD